MTQRSKRGTVAKVKRESTKTMARCNNKLIDPESTPLSGKMHPNSQNWGFGGKTKGVKQHSSNNNLDIDGILKADREVELSDEILEEEYKHHNEFYQEDHGICDYD